jgi:NAD(P)H-flavin reductase/hemoglobin-like flavoprotein
VAIALGGGSPDSDPDGDAGQPGLGPIQKQQTPYPGKLPDLAYSFAHPSPADDEISPVDPADPGRRGAFRPDKGSASTEGSATRIELDHRLLKESFARLTAHAPSVMEYFYARLFAASPDTRALFPMSMTAQRERMFEALARVIWSLDNQPYCAELLSQLGRDHRRFGVTDRHYGMFFVALRDTAEHFLGTGWTRQAAAAWQAALDFMSATMRSAATQDAEVAPAWWTAEIIGHESRSPGVALLKLRPSEPLPYQAGQYVPVQVTRWPRVWRPYSIANAPRPGGLIDLHVRAVPGGLVSNTLVHHSVTGDSVLLGAAAGNMTLGDSERDLLCVAGGTGLAPIKAIIEQALVTPWPRGQRKITLFFGARQQFDLYDLEDLQLLEAACPGLRVLPVLSEEPDYGGLTGMLPDVVGGHGLFENADAYICGPAAMVRQTAAVLAAGIPASQIHHDPLP